MQLRKKVFAILVIGLKLFFTCGRGSVGRASPCQGEGRGFESRRPLQFKIIAPLICHQSFNMVLPGKTTSLFRRNGFNLTVKKPC